MRWTRMETGRDAPTRSKKRAAVSGVTETRRRTWRWPAGLSGALAGRPPPGRRRTPRRRPRCSARLPGCRTCTVRTLRTADGTAAPWRSRRPRGRSGTCTGCTARGAGRPRTRPAACGPAAAGPARRASRGCRRRAASGSSARAWRRPRARLSS